MVQKQHTNFLARPSTIEINKTICLKEVVGQNHVVFQNYIHIFKNLFNLCHKYATHVNRIRIKL